MNKAMTLLAEDLGFSFVLYPVKYRSHRGSALRGSALGMLLARRGYRILLVDRDTFPSDMPMSALRAFVTVLVMPANSRREV
jgi:hypothetical protein